MLNTVIFAGAGFSRPFGFPVMATFFREVENGSMISDAEREVLRTLRMEANAADSIVQGDLMDMEHILSYSVMAMGADSQEEQKKINKYDQLAAILGKVYTHVDNLRSTGGSIHGMLKRLLHAGDATKLGNLTVVTTNYDCMWEWGLSSIGLRASLPFDHTPINKVHHLYSQTNSGPVLCKLHGSVNWFATDDGEIEVQGQIAMGMIPDGPNPGSIEFPKIMDPQYDWSRAPLVVPPTFSKVTPLPRLVRNWDVARRAIEHANRLVFIGYSFPRSDTHMKYFLGAAISKAKRLHEIQIVDPKATEICKRLAEEGEYGKHFLGRLRTLNDQWQSLTLEQILKA